MKTIQVQLDDAAYDALRLQATSAGQPIEQTVGELLARHLKRRPEQFIGSFADEPDLMDAVAQDAMQTRERAAWRVSGGEEADRH